MAQYVSMRAVVVKAVLSFWSLRDKDVSSEES
jgi:hypothetical protein